jgi:RNA-directed DNA polymerase
MLAALGNGVRGGKWFSLIDKVYRPETLGAAWKKVAKNAGAAGVEGKASSSLGFERKSIWQSLNKRSRAESTGQSRSGAWR